MASEMPVGDPPWVWLNSPWPNYCSAHYFHPDPRPWGLREQDWDTFRLESDLEPELKTISHWGMFNVHDY